MTDAHCHVPNGESRHFLCGDAAAPDVAFYGTHPWFLEAFDDDALRQRLVANPHVGVGEIGLDRLKARTIGDSMRRVFESQLVIADEFARPVVLHGAKCWGEVIGTIRRVLPDSSRRVPAFLFHGFSRSGGLLPDIVSLNGYVSIGPAILNDHAVNYRELAKAIPLDRLLVESDRTAENATALPDVTAIAARLSEVRGMGLAELVTVLEQNADHFIASLS